MHKPITVEKIAERKKQRALLEKIFGRPQRTFRRPKPVKPTNTRKNMNISDAAFQRCVAEFSTGRFKIKYGEINTAWKFAPTVKERKRRTRKKAGVHRRLTLIHRPTGVTMDAYVEPGNYSKSEMRKLRDKTVKEYMSFLESKVNSYLKACMARQFGPIPKGEYGERPPRRKRNEK